MKTVSRNNYAPKVCDFTDTVVYDAAAGLNYLFDHDGIFTRFSANNTFVDVADTVSIAPGEPARVEAKRKDDNLYLTFYIPQGVQGVPGLPGVDCYHEFTDKPKINGVELADNKTAEALGLATSQDLANANQEIDFLTGEVSDAKQEIGLLKAEQTLQNDRIQENTNKIAALETLIQNMKTSKEV